MDVIEDRILTIKAPALAPAAVKDRPDVDRSIVATRDGQSAAGSNNAAEDRGGMIENGLQLSGLAIPEAHGVVGAGGDDPSPFGGEGDGFDGSAVSNIGFDQSAGLRVEEADDVVVTSGEDFLAIGREGNSPDGPGVLQPVERLSIFQVPDDGGGVLAAG